jgi:hypothetical protein
VYYEAVDARARSSDLLTVNTLVAKNKKWLPDKATIKRYVQKARGSLSSNNQPEVEIHIRRVSALPRFHLPVTFLTLTHLTFLSQLVNMQTLCEQHGANIKATKIFPPDAEYQQRQTILDRLNTGQVRRSPADWLLSGC